MHPKLRLLLVYVVVILACAWAAHFVESGLGQAEVSRVSIIDPASGVELAGKLYVPKSASQAAPKPAVLLLHGFQNDKETEGGYALELARRGFVALALDQFGHGDSGRPVSGSGALSGEASDPTLGGDAAYDYLKSLPYVDAAHIGVTGHSMGAGSTLAVGAANPDHAALNPKCGSAGSPELNNVLLTQARWEEFIGFREGLPTTAGLTTDAARLADLGLSGSAEWNTTYGSFADGSARRQALVNTVHPGVTHSGAAIGEGLLWMQQALKGSEADADWIPADQHIFMWKELFMLLGMLAALAALFPLCELLLGLPFFAGVAQPVPVGYVARGWWKMATLNALIAGISWPVLAGVGAFGISAAVPALRMIIANGVMGWWLGNVLIYLVIFAFWYRKAKKQGVTTHQLGVSFDEKKMRLDWALLGKTLLLGTLLVAFAYLAAAACQWLFGIELRFIWPFMRQFTGERFGHFWVYALAGFLFFAINGGLFLFGQARPPTAATPRRTRLAWWGRACYAALFGLLLVWAFQYLPFFLGSAPGFELIGMVTFSGMIPLLLFVYLPEFVILLYLLTWFFQRSGRVYLGAWVVACLVAWWITAGTAIL